MGEIERIHPVLRTVLENRLDHKVDRNRDRRQHHAPDQDQTDLTNVADDADAQATEPPKQDPDCHLDLSA